MIACFILNMYVMMYRRREELVAHISGKIQVYMRFIPILIDTFCLPVVVQLLLRIFYMYL